MKVTVLGSGTSQGVPQIGCSCEACTSSNPKDNRTRSSIMVTSDTTNIVIDTGPEFRIQMLREKVTKLDGVVFTHEHADHLHGLDDVRSFTNRTGKEMDVYAEERVQGTIQKTFDYIFHSKYRGIAKINLKPISKDLIRIGDITLQPIRMFHHKLPVYGFRIGNFAYLTDFKTIQEEEKKKLEGVDVLLIEALHIQEHISHINLEQSLNFIEQLKPQKSFLTHISHNMPIFDKLSSILPKGVFPAYDGQKIEIEN